MQRTARWAALLDAVAAHGRVEIEPAAEQLGVSAATVRRDLDELAAQRLLVRTRGGAVSHSVSYDLPMRYKTSQHSEEKEAIAAAAAAIVPPGGVVGLNGGTTTTEVARALVLRDDPADAQSRDIEGTPQFTVVTNAVNIANELAVRPQIKLVLTGGVVRSQTYELVGPLALPAIERLTLDVAILGVDGITAADGAGTRNEMEAAVNQAMLMRANQVVVVADHTKLGQQAFARICATADIDLVVTGTAASPTEVAALRAAGVHVTLVDP